MAVPQFVIDAPGGGGKVPLLPEYVEEINDDEVVSRNYLGQRFTYKQPRQLETAEAGERDAAAAAASAAESGIVSIESGKKKRGLGARRRKAAGE